MNYLAELVAGGWEVTITSCGKGSASVMIWAEGRGCHQYRGELETALARAWAGEPGD